MAVLVGYDASSSKMVFYVRGKSFPSNRNGWDYDYIPDPIVSDSDVNPYIEIWSNGPCFVNVDYGDGTIKQYPFYKRKGSTAYTIYFRGLDIEYQKNPDSHPWWFFKDDGSEYIPVPPHKYADGEDKDRVVTMEFTNDIRLLRVVNQILPEYPLIDCPSIEEINIVYDNLLSLDIPFDKFGRANKIKKFQLAACSLPGKFTSWPEGMLRLTEIEDIQANGTFNFYDYENSNVRELKVWKKLNNNNFNFCNIPYVNEWNELPNLGTLAIMSDYDDWPIIEPDSINPSIWRFQFIGSGTSWKDDLVCGKGLEHITSTSIQYLKTDFTITPKWLFEMRSLVDFVIPYALGTQKKIDDFVIATYNSIVGWENTTMSSVSVDGLRNQFYGMRFSCFDSRSPSGVRPSGVLQAPDGFVKGHSNGNPTTPMEKIYVLTNNYNQRWVVAPEATSTLSRSVEPFKLYSMTEVDGDVVIGTGELITSSWLFKFNSPFEAEDELRRRGMDASVVEKWFKQREEDAYVFSE